MRRYRLGAHTKTDLKIHIIWSPKYRKKVLSGQVAIRNRDILRQIALEHELDVVLMDVQMQEMDGLEGKFVAGYIGTHGMVHALETILEAAVKLKNCEDGDDIRFVLLGHGAKKKDLQKKPRK